MTTVRLIFNKTEVAGVEMIWRMRLVCLRLVVCLSAAAISTSAPGGIPQEATAPVVGDPALDSELEKINAELKISLQKQLSVFPVIDESEQGAVGKFSHRADIEFFLGEFEKAEADYQKMVRLQPDLDSSHWRLGIAMYFAGHPEQAAAQFDKYHSFDNVDRENGIWRYLSHRAAFGKGKAREQLLKYEKDDRPPFKEVYRLFDGSLSEEDVLKSVSADLPEEARNSRLFYAHLYIGLNCSADGQTGAAMRSLRIATLNPWPRQAGFGPNYMWHVGRLQYLRLKAVAETQDLTDERE